MTGRQATPDVLGALPSTGSGSGGRDDVALVVGGARKLRVSEIRRDGGTQPRAALDWTMIEEFAEAMTEGAKFPPVTVVYDGTSYWLVDGFHRVAAVERLGWYEIPAEVSQGTLADAQWMSYGVNKTHGLRRTNEDKRRAVEAALAHPKAATMSNYQIAAHCGVSDQTIANYRKSIYQTLVDEPTERVVTRGDSTYVMNTANIGASKQEDAPEPDVEPEPELTFWEVVEDTAEDEEPEVIEAEPVILEPWENPTRVGRVLIVNGDSLHLHSLVDVLGTDLVITSPPYNVGIGYQSYEDQISATEYLSMLHRVFTNCYEVMNDGGRICVVVPFGVNRNPWQPVAARVADVLDAVGFTLRGQIIWDKGNSGNRTSWGSWRSPSDPSLRDTCEAILVGHKGSSKVALPDGTLTAEGHSPWLPGELFMELAQDHWTVAPESAQRIGHPAPFPVQLVERLIRFYGWPGCRVLDPFAGSGTVGVAAQALGCEATLVDMDEAYCRLAVRRCENGR